MRFGLERTRDPDIVNAILSDPWISERLRIDGRVPGYIDNPAIEYYAAYVESSLAGIFILGKFSAFEAEVHVALARWSIKDGRELAAMFLDRVLCDGVQRASAWVLSSLPSTANFCRRLGFVDEGRKREAVRRDGKPLDLLLLGLTAEEWRLRR